MKKCIGILKSFNIRENLYQEMSISKLKMANVSNLANSALIVATLKPPQYSHTFLFLSNVQKDTSLVWAPCDLIPLMVCLFYTVIFS